MLTYEIIILCHPQVDSEGVDSLIKKIQEIVSSNGGEMKVSNIWGKKKLAYEIKGCKEANFVYLEFCSSPQVLAQVDKNCKITDAIVRYMITKKRNVHSEKDKITAQVTETVNNKGNQEEVKIFAGKVD